MSLRYLKIFVSVCLVCICSLFIAALLKYPGHAYSYILFSLLLNALLFAGFRKERIFFDTFIGLFMWLGFWLKFSIRDVFLNGIFNESVGNFVYSGPMCDRVLNVTSCGIFALLMASFLREKFFFSYSRLRGSKFNILFEFYKKNRKKVFGAFLFLFLVIAIANVYFGIYQRGSMPQVRLPFKLGSIYSWLLQFGLTSFSAVILDFELEVNSHPYAATFLSMMETFFSNVSMLSRGMILNLSALLLGADEAAKRKSVPLNLRFKIVVLALSAFLFIGSIFTVNFIRASRWSSGRGKGGAGDSGIIMTAMVTNTKALFIDRFIGMEGMMAVVSYPKIGWDLWNLAWKEKFSDVGTSFYDLNIITSPYINLDLTKNHFVSVPGFLAFLFYTGSTSFLFFATFGLYFLAAAIEWGTYKFGGSNLILCSLLGQVVAARYANLGYVPAQSYLLLGAICLNILIFYILNKILCIWKRNPSEHRDSYDGRKSRA